jgi:osmoprotectant transport system substrate-binding protein
MPRFRHLSAALAVLAALAVGCGGDDDDAASTTAAASAGGEAAAATFTFKPLDVGGPITKEALRKGDIDIALIFTSDADIAVEGWVLLDDDKKLQQIENLTPAIRSDKADPAAVAALDAVSAKLTTAELTEMNRQNSVDGRKPGDVAKAWLEKNKLVPYSGDKTSVELTVGSTNFAEQEIVAELYAQVLESAGGKVDRKFQLGAREIVAPALEKGEIDLYPEYLGTYTVFLDKAATVPSDPAEAATAINALLEPKKLQVLTPAPAEDRNGFVVTKETAGKFGLATMSDLAKVTEPLVLGGPPECPERPFCIVGLRDTYGLSFDV